MTFSDSPIQRFALAGMLASVEAAVDIDDPWLADAVTVDSQQ